MTVYAEYVYANSGTSSRANQSKSNITRIVSYVKKFNQVKKHNRVKLKKTC